MCGRYRLSRRKEIIEEYFDTAPWDDDWSPRYNIAPTQPIPVVRIRMREGCDSLNAAVATGVILFEIAGQQR